MKMNQKRYSEAFKRHVCEEIKEGKWSSTNEVAKAYNIGTKTVIDWVDELGYGHLRQRRIEVKTPKEVSEIARLKAELKKTKEMLCDEVLKNRFESSFLQLACDELNVSVETLKKKLALNSVVRFR